MYVQSIKFKREKDSEWERGYYIGDTDNSDKSIILDLKYKPVRSIWYEEVDTENWIQFRCPEPETKNIKLNANNLTNASDTTNVFEDYNKGKQGICKAYECIFNNKGFCSSISDKANVLLNKECTEYIPLVGDAEI